MVRLGIYKDLESAHSRLLDRHARHVDELRGDIVQIVQKHIPRQTDMKARQERVDALTEALTKFLAGASLDDPEE